MSLNLTSTYLEARISPAVLLFSRQLATGSAHIPGPGGLEGDGYPIPIGGRIAGLHVYDGLVTRSVEPEYTLNAGDRVCLFATYTAGNDFTVSVIVNGIITNVEVTGIPANSGIFVSLLILCKEDNS